jgi:hypothetical protein
VYLRELPQPLLTFEYYDQWIQTARMPDNEERLRAARRYLDCLPRPNYENLSFLVRFFAEVCQVSHWTVGACKRMRAALFVRAFV